MCSYMYDFMYMLYMYKCLHIYTLLVSGLSDHHTCIMFRQSWVAVLFWWIFSPSLKANSTPQLHCTTHFVQ